MYLPPCLTLKIHVLFLRLVCIFFISFANKYPSFATAVLTGWSLWRTKCSLLGTNLKFNLLFFRVLRFSPAKISPPLLSICRSVNTTHIRCTNGRDWKLLNKSFPIRGDVIRRFHLRLQIGGKHGDAKEMKLCTNFSVAVILILNVHLKLKKKPEGLGKKEMCCLHGSSLSVRGSNPGGGEIFRTRPDLLSSPPSLLYKGYSISFPGVKWPGLGANHSPPSSAEVKERVELYRCSPSGDS